MEWVRRGLIYKPEQKYDWAQSHAQVPTAELLENNKIRIYFCSRDKNNRSYSSYIESDAKSPERILYKHNKPILKLGKAGSFDDNGIMPTTVIKYQNKIFFYYIGWNTGNTARYRVAHGLAISDDNAKTFLKVSEGPIMDRSMTDPISVSNHSIIIENGIWRMWYMSYTKWEKFNNFYEPYYIIKYAESKDGIIWSPKGNICIDLKNENEAGIARPYVLKENGIYKMWYSYRNKSNYRKSKKDSYRIGYAESKDGLKWERKDNLFSIGLSPSGWDSEMIAYPNIYKTGNKKYLLYNGNGFGQSGFGYLTEK